MYLLLHSEMVASLREQGSEQAEAKLRSTGFATGLRLITRLTASKIPITTERMVMKFVCKELWTYLFNKPASRLQVDKQGRYLIQDHAFRWLQSFPVLSADAPRSVNSTASQEASVLSELQELTALHLALPCGVLQGALFGLGLERRVAADATLPSVTFTVAQATPSMASGADAGAAAPSEASLNL
ncbi:Trappc6b [Symbiodinium natans]|uniref:Trappc6b protein n=1 Tax=Symbiodinium natans TaxID=878477 RepID=A0A812TSX1_9DINO|nr:Trappc6b [Symbiodinium natans]